MTKKTICKLLQPLGLALFVLCIASHAALAFASDGVGTTFAAKILVDELAPSPQQCTLVATVHETQLHRRVQGPDDIYEERTVRQNRDDVEELAKLPRDATNQVYIEIFGASRERVTAALSARCPGGVVEPRAAPVTAPPQLSGNGTLASTSPPLPSPAAAGTTPTALPIIKRLVNSGDPANRIDIVFMGDGYMAAEETKFFADMQRLTDDMFAGETFAQYLPLFNIWAVLQPSAESGIGVGGKPKNTVFGLYRPGTELRAIYMSKALEARRVCALVGANACDFPSIIGNDDYYGGLGGEFVITTRSPTSGTITLRHELGHNFGNVGEEYDGGDVYSGANSATSLATITWKHWLTTPNVVHEENAALTYTAYPWYDLKSGPYTISFTASGAYKRWMLLVSLSGAAIDTSITITFDGKPLAWTSSGVMDRTFYKWVSRTQGLTAGKHDIIVTGNGPFNGAIIQQLCSVDLTEYMDESEFRMDDNNVISAYPTWSTSNRKTYRPSNEKCPMRNMLSTTFCSVCIENMWLRFFERVQLIDGVVVIDSTLVQVIVIPLGQLRVNAKGAVGNELLTVQWFRAGVEHLQFRDQFQVDMAALMPLGSAAGQWTVRVKFQTPSVRLDPMNLLQSETTFTIQP